MAYCNGTSPYSIDVFGCYSAIRGIIDNPESSTIDETSVVVSYEYKNVLDVEYIVTHSWFVKTKLSFALSTDQWTSSLKLTVTATSELYHKSASMFRRTEWAVHNSTSSKVEVTYSIGSDGEIVSSFSPEGQSVASGIREQSALDILNSIFSASAVAVESGNMTGNEMSVTCSGQGAIEKTRGDTSIRISTNPFGLHGGTDRTSLLSGIVTIQAE